MHTEQKWLPLLSRAAACGLAGVVLTLMLSWLAAFAVNRELLPEVDTRLIALICCAIACLITGAFSPQPEKGRALGGAMTWAVWVVGYLILKASVGAPLFCAETAVTLVVALAASIIAFFIKSYEIEQRRKNGNRVENTESNHPESLHNVCVITYI